jgi:phage-related protein
VARDGTVTVKITGDAKGLHDALNDSDSKLSGFGSKMGSVAKGVGLGFAAMGAAAVPFGIKAVQVASDVNESFSKVNTIFGESTGAIDKWAKSAATNIGLSRGAALDAAGTFGNMFTQLGIGTDQAAKMSTGIVDLAADFASFHNADISEVISSQSAAFRGEYDALQKFLPLINAASVEQKALAMTGKATTKELTAQDKALAVQTLMMEGAGAAQGDFARTSDGLANKMRILKARGEDFMATVGTALLPIVLKGIDVFMNLGGVLKDNLGPVFEKVKVVVADLEPVFRTIVEAVQGFIDKFRGGEGEIGASASKLGEIIGQIKAVFESAFAAIKAVVEVATAIIQNIWGRFGGTLLEFIKGTWAAIMEVVRGALNILGGFFDLIKAILTGKWGEAWEAIKRILDGAWDLIFGTVRNALTNVLPTIFGAAQALLSGAFGLIWNALKTVAADALDLIKTGVKNGLDAIVTFFKDLPGRLAGLGRGMFNFVGDAFKAAINHLIGMWNDFKLPAVKILGVQVSPEVNFPDITPLATGGIVSRPTLAMLGEAGPEAVIPLSRIGGTSAVVHNHYDIAVTAIDPAAASEAVVTAIREYERRNGQGWRT